MLKSPYKIVPKPHWKNKDDPSCKGGKEVWIVNKEQYCGKILHFPQYSRCSNHMHLLKDEVMYVNKGKVKIVYSWEENSEQYEHVVLNVGDSFHIPVGLWHMICALEESEVIEFSTQHFDEDSYRSESILLFDWEDNEK